MKKKSIKKIVACLMASLLMSGGMMIAAPALAHSTKNKIEKEKVQKPEKKQNLEKKERSRK